MKIRAAKFMAAIIASILSSASAFAAPEDAAAPDATEQPAEHCLTSPRDYAPPGTRWRYRVERSSGRRCWFLKDDAAKSAGKVAGQPTAATEEAAPAPSRKRSAASRTVSDARAEFSQAPVEQETKPAMNAPAPAASAPAVDGNQPSAAKTATNMLAPATATRWPDPMATGNPVANQPAPPAAPAAVADQSAEMRAAPPQATPPAKPQVMPRAVPPVPVSEKPMSLPMLITIIAGGLSVLGVLASLLFAWLASRRAQLSPTAPMPPLELSETPRRPGDLYRERKRLRAKLGKRRAA